MGIDIGLGHSDRLQRNGNIVDTDLRLGQIPGDGRVT